MRTQQGTDSGGSTKASPDDTSACEDDESALPKKTQCAGAQSSPVAAKETDMSMGDILSQLDVLMSGDAGDELHKTLFQFFRFRK